MKRGGLVFLFGVVAAAMATVIVATSPKRPRYQGFIQYLSAAVAIRNNPALTNQQKCDGIFDIELALINDWNGGKPTVAGTAVDDFMQRIAGLTAGLGCPM